MPQVEPWYPAGPDSPRSPANGLSPTNDVVQVVDAGSDRKDIYISCCDAIGLGCMVARALIDADLRICSCDFSTDGRWCFMMFQVDTIARPSHPTTDFALLRESLIEICPADSLGALYFKPKFAGKDSKAEYHILRVKCRDRSGLIHSLIDKFWRHKVTIHRLKCITRGEEAVDEFYISDDTIRDEGDLPIGLTLETPPRPRFEALIADITDSLGATVQLEPLAEEDEREMRSIRRTRRLEYADHTKVVAARQFRGLLTTPFRAKDGGSEGLSLTDPLLKSPSTCIDFAHEASSCGSPARLHRHWKACVEVDTWRWSRGGQQGLSEVNTILKCTCPDRKGILYDFFRLLSDVSLKASYGRISTGEGGSSGRKCEAMVFVKDSKTGGQISNEEKLKDLILSAIQKPFSLDIKPSEAHEGLVELKVVAPVDSSGRGRPRVIYDVTTALSSLGAEIWGCEMFVTGRLEDMSQKEHHIFHCKPPPRASQRLIGRMEEAVFCELMGVLKTKRRGADLKKKLRYCCC